MNNDLISKDIKNLLDAGIITKEEYEKIVNRLEDYRSINKIETCKSFLEKYKQNLKDSGGYKERSIYRMYIDAKQYVEFVYKKNNITAETLLNMDFDAKLFTTETGRMYMTSLLVNKEATTISSLATSYKVFVKFINKQYYTGIDENAINDIVELARKKVAFEKSRDCVTDKMFSEDEIYFMSELGDTVHKLVILLCYEACMSREEIAAAEFTDVDFDKEVIKVKDPVTEEIRRIMPLTHDLCRLLKSHRDELLELNEQYNITRQKKKQSPRIFTEYIFQSRRSGTATPTMITYKLTDIAKAWYEYNYEMHEGEMSYEEFVENSVQVTFPTIRKSKIISMIGSKEWTLDDVIYKYNLGSAYYMNRKFSDINN